MKGKTYLNSLRKGYFKVPFQIKSMGLSSKALMVYFYLCSYSEDFNPSVRYLASELGISKVTVKDCLDELVTKQIIVLLKQGNRTKPNEYMFNSPKKWRKDGNNI
jgi:predicted DNA-binding transcriptional regulator